MCKNSAIPTCGFRVWEDSIFPVMLQRCLLSSSTTSVEHTFCVLQPYHVGICCCFFLQGVCVGSSLSASQMERTMKLLRRRLQSRLALQKQFASLGMLLTSDHTLNPPKEDRRFWLDCSCPQSTASSQSPVSVCTCFLPRSCPVYLAGPLSRMRSTRYAHLHMHIQLREHSCRLFLDLKKH